MDPVRAVREALGRGERAALLTVVETHGKPPSKPGMQLAVLEDGTTYGTLGCDGFDQAGAADGTRCIADGALESRYEWDGKSHVLVKVTPYSPGERVGAGSRDIPELLIVGVGPVARALVALGEPLGFQVRVAAGPVAPGLDDFEGADEVILTPDVRSVAALRPGSNTYVVICGHDKEFSQPVLEALLRSDAPYLGIMGSHRHTGHLAEDLRRIGFDDQAIARVHSPVGLDIGSETPEEIALSALAEIIAYRRGRPVRSIATR